MESAFYEEKLKLIVPQLLRMAELRSAAESQPG